MAPHEDDISPSGDTPFPIKTMTSSVIEEKDSKDMDRAANTMDEKEIMGDTEVILIKDIDKGTALDVETDVEAVMDKVISLSIEECRKLIEELLEDHKYDYNFTQSQKDKLRDLLAGPVENQTVGE